MYKVIQYIIQTAFTIYYKDDYFIVFYVKQK